MNDILKKYGDYIENLKGKKYITVAGRILWFRDENPNGEISTEVKQVGDLVIVKAFVIVEGKLLATGMATVRAGTGTSWSGREIEKAETASIGRALAHSGWGTQFALSDISEGDYLSDSPIGKQLNIAGVLDLQGKSQWWELLKSDTGVIAIYNHEKHLINTLKKLANDGVDMDTITYGSIRQMLIDRKQDDEKVA